MTINRNDPIHPLLTQTTIERLLTNQLNT